MGYGMDKFQTSMPVLFICKFHNELIKNKNIELIQDLMSVLVTCKIEEDLIKHKSMSCPHHFFRPSRANNSKVNGQIWLKCILVPDIMPVVVTCRLDEDPIKTEGTIVSTTFSLL